MFRNVQKVSESFRKFQKIQKVSESFRNFLNTLVKICELRVLPTDCAVFQTPNLGGDLFAGYIFLLCTYSNFVDCQQLNHTWLQYCCV